MDIFKNNKYTNWYFSIVENAKSQQRKKRGEVYYESHHIVPRCMDGEEKVLLTAREHFICHWLLIYMVGSQTKYKMQYALIQMMRSSKGQQRIKSSHLYEIAKKHNAEATSFFMKGNKYAKGGNFIGKQHSQSSNEKNKISHLGKYTRSIKRNVAISLAKKGKSNGREGHKHTEETKQKMSESAKSRGGIKSGLAAHKNKTGIHGLSFEEKKKYSQKGITNFLQKHKNPEFQKLHSNKIKFGRLVARFNRLPKPTKKYFGF